jgi:4-amino-4-deoxy-L-arabinose transferase-like glycosyltransferase
VNKTLKAHWPFLLLWITLSVLPFQALGQIPFHPDESTNIYMSQDFYSWLAQPNSLGWDPAKISDPLQRYRAIDPPLARYLIGLGRYFAGLQPIKTDWDWAAGWDENQNAGALPGNRLLFAARFALTALLPFSFLLIYRCGIHVEGKTTGLLATVILGLSGLTQLHARRAMSEGALLFGVLLVIWAVTHPRPRGWLIGLAMALAFNAKHSAATLLPVAFLAAGWLPDYSDRTVRSRLVSLALAGTLFVVLTALLNPFSWQNSIQAVKWGFQERVSFLNSQVSEFATRNPDLVQRTVTGRLTATLAQLYLLDPSFAEAGNYSETTGEVETAYLAGPGSQLLRGPIWGAFLLILTIFGMILGIRTIRPPWKGQARGLFLFLMSTGFFFTAIIWAVQLPFQRYYFPLLPFVSLWSAFGVANVIAALQNGQRPSGKITKTL